MTKEEIREIIQQQFPSLNDPKFLDDISAVSVYREVPAGEQLIHTGAYMRFLPLIVKGSLKILREDAEGREILLYYVDAGETCTSSMSCCMSDHTSTISAVVEEDAAFIAVPVMYADEWLLKYRVWKNFIQLSYTWRFEGLLQAFDQLAFHHMDDRLLHYIEEKIQLHKTKILQLGHKEIAADLNTSREVVSRLLKKLETQGKIVLGRNRIEYTGKE